jgi:hypothetical protein
MASSVMKPAPKDAWLAAALSAAGIVAILLAVRGRWALLGMNPGIEGCLVCGVAGFGFSLLHGIAYARAVALSAPVVGLQAAVCAAAGGPVLAVVGIELAVMGLAGIALALRAVPVTSTPPEEGRSRSDGSISRRLATYARRPA